MSFFFVLSVFLAIHGGVEAYPQPAPQPTTGVPRCGPPAATTLPPSPSPSASPCADAFPDCGVWATQGFCTNNVYTAEQRKLYCAATCSLCAAPSTTPTVKYTTPTITTPKPTTAPSCVDAYPDCGVWASQGFCNNTYYTPEQRKQYCPATCSLCTAPTTTTTAPCVDAYPDCGVWASQGFCNNTYYTPEQRKQYCPATCLLCTAPTTTTTAPCVDAYPDCGVWASQGFCTNTYYTQEQRKQYCPATCSLCTAPTTTTTTTTPKPTTTPPCVDAYPDCGIWASQGFCTNTFYTTAQRKQYCAATCSFCAGPSTPAPTTTKRPVNIYG